MQKALETQDEKGKAAGKKQLAPKLDELKQEQAKTAQEVKARRGNIQRWQELGGLTGRILFAVLLTLLPSRLLLRLFLVPGVVLFPITYFVLVKGDYDIFAAAVFFCGLLTVAQMSYMSEYLPKVFPVHLAAPARLRHQCRRPHDRHDGRNLQHRVPVDVVYPVKCDAGGGRDRRGHRRRHHRRRRLRCGTGAVAPVTFPAVRRTDHAGTTWPRRGLVILTLCIKHIRKHIDRNNLHINNIIMIH